MSAVRGGAVAVRRGDKLEPRAALCGRLRARRREIERATIDRVYGVADPAAVKDPAYLAGLKAAVSAALACGIAAIEEGESHPTPLPNQLLAQARHAARSGVCLETVLRRYFAGYALLCDFIVEEAEEGGLSDPTDLQVVLRSEAALLDRFVIAATNEYTQEVARERPRTMAQRRLEAVWELLEGKPANEAVLDYDLDSWHIALVALGGEATESIRELASTLDRAVLMVETAEQVTWAWLGGRIAVGAEDVLRLTAAAWPAGSRLAIGEPAHGLEGWRLSHHQALLALPIAERELAGPVRYADVALLASLIRDEVLSRSLEDLYLEPLAAERDGGKTLRETLEAYLRAQCNVSSAAAALDVSRKTVNTRLRVAEERIGRPISACAAELELTLRLGRLGSIPGVRRTSSR